MRQDDHYGSELRGYLIGLALAAGLSFIPFACVAGHVLPRSGLLWVIGITALSQVVAHFRFFLHIDLSASRREDLQLILFSTLIVILMVAGTIWIIGNQHHRMM